MHSLAFGSLLPFLAEDPKEAISRRQMEMTLDVMANSLVFWVQDLWRAGLLERGSKVYAMTSEGSARTIPSYGAVSAAKAALESHCRQLAMELARLDSGVAVNALRAGVTETPALRKIPEAARVIEHTLLRNPHGRLTTVEDVAETIVMLASTDSDWISGNVINVDGGEFHTG
jgi:enoyl-[acyl-carrier-protein] reductase (NADH)